MTAPLTQTAPPENAEPQDLGFGPAVTRQSRERLLNPGGSFNVRRSGLGIFESVNPFHFLLSMSWPAFFGLVILVYLGLNAIFAGLYLLAGPGALGGPGETALGQFGRAFFFSVETLATIGYGTIYPVSTAANALMTAESMVALLVFALSSGIMFSRFARPRALIRFSRNAVIAPYREGKAFEFRIANVRNTQIIELTARVLYSWRDGAGNRYFEELALERRKVVFFPLSWTVVHPIDEHSPLRDMDARRLEEVDAEFLVLLTGTDEVLSQMVHARSSYKPHEIRWNVRFANILERADGTVTVDVGRIHDLEPA